jgi:hypothetical protein
MLSVGNVRGEVGMDSKVAVPGGVPVVSAAVIVPVESALAF